MKQSLKKRQSSFSKAQKRVSELNTRKNKFIKKHYREIKAGDSHYKKVLNSINFKIKKALQHLKKTKRKLN